MEDPSFSEILKQELLTIKFDLLNPIDLINKKQDHTLAFKDIVKIYCKELLFLQQFSTLIQSSFLFMPNLNKQKKGKQVATTQDLLYKLPNINQENLFQQTTDNKKKISILKVKNGDDSQGMKILWIIKTIKYANLKFRKCNTWNITVDSKLNVLDKIRTFLETKCPPGNKQVKVVDLWICIYAIEFYIRDQISLIENGEENKQKKNICDGKKFSFTDNAIANIHLNPGHNIRKF